jgi:plastocyanin
VKVTKGLLVIAAALACVAGVLPGREGTAADATISATGTTTPRFAPNSVEVAVGDTVTFRWGSGVHTAHAVNGEFAILLGAGESGTWTPAAPGVYYFYCFIHANAALATEGHVAANDAMVGKVVVTAAQAPVPALHRAVAPMLAADSATGAAAPGGSPGPPLPAPAPSPNPIPIPAPPPIPDPGYGGGNGGTIPY